MAVISEQERKILTGTTSDVREISIAHSPDSDDAFMFYGLATNKVRVPGLRFTHKLCDIETLNRDAQRGVYDVTAISFHAYPYIQENYALMACGGLSVATPVVSDMPYTSASGTPTACQKPMTSGGHGAAPTTATLSWSRPSP